MSLRSNRISSNASSPPSIRRSQGRRIFVGALALATATLVIGASPAIAKTAKHDGPAARHAGGNASDKADFYDSRQDPSVAKVLGNRAANMAARPKSGVTALRKQLGRQGVISMDPLTGTARDVSKLNGFLTGSSKQSAKTVALRYVSAHPDVFGLDSAGVARLQLRRDYVDVAGTHHLSFEPDSRGRTHLQQRSSSQRDEERSSDQRGRLAGGEPADRGSHAGDLRDAGPQRRGLGSPADREARISAGPGRCPATDQVQQR